jgi:ubiquinone/menaquinone biosynthesis C-methylase UbiE
MAAEDYREASLKMWEGMAEGWERRRAALWDRTRPVGQWLVDALDPKPGETILELAAGLGDSGFEAAARVQPDGRLITTDFSPSMVEAARRHADEVDISNAEIRTMDAEKVDLPDGSVDAVLCRFGYMLMADPGAALRETRRVLGDGGRVAFAVWGAPKRNPWVTVSARALMEQTGAPPPDPDAPGIFAMSDPERTRRLVAGAGLELRRMEEVEVRWVFESADEFWRWALDMAGPLSVAVLAMPPDDQAAVRAKVGANLEPHTGADGRVELPGVASTVLAAK